MTLDQGLLGLSESILLTLLEHVARQEDGHTSLASLQMTCRELRDLVRLFQRAHIIFVNVESLLAFEHREPYSPPLADALEGERLCMENVCRLALGVSYSAPTDEPAGRGLGLARPSSGGEQ